MPLIRIQMYVKVVLQLSRALGKDSHAYVVYKVRQRPAKKVKIELVHSCLSPFTSQSLRHAVHMLSQSNNGVRDGSSVYPRLASSADL